MHSIRFDHVTKCYTPGVPVLEDVSFEEEDAGAIGYLGPNGAGKTTTLKLLVGLLRPSGGRVTVNGHDPGRDRRRALYDVGAVIEEPQPYPAETIFDALDRVGRLRGLDRSTIDEEIDRLHEALHLPPLPRRCGGLSKGERQRVVLAAACLGDPEVLLLDEPTNGMDPGERVEVRRFLKRLKHDHLILMSSHLLTDVSEICDRLLVLNAGRIVLSETVERFNTRAAIRELDVEFAMPVGEVEIERLAPSVRGITPLGGHRYRLLCRDGPAGRAELLAACESIAPVLAFAPSLGGLEDAYREVVSSPPEKPA